MPVPVARGGSVALGIVGEPLSLNPLLTGGNAPAVEAISQLWTLGLLRLDPLTNDPVPQAALELPTVDNGGLELNDDGTMTVTFQMNPEVTWVDGSAVTGNDVAFTYDLMTDPALPIRPDLRALHSLVIPESVEASASSVSFVLERPTIRYLSMFAILVPESEVDGTDFTDEWNEQTWMSAGPFKFTSWDPGRELVFDANPGYWGNDAAGDPLPYLDRVTIRPFAGDDELLAAFRLQTVDAAAIAVNDSILAELEQSPSVELQIAAGPEYEHLAFEFGEGRFNSNPLSLNESRDFREAVARLIDRESLVAGVFGERVGALDTIVGVSWPQAGTDAWAQYAPDSELEAGLLASALTELDQSELAVRFSTSTSLGRTQIAGAILQRFAERGVSADVELLELGEFFRDRVLTGDFDIAEWAWRATPGPVGAVIDLEDRFLLLPEDDGYNFYRWGADGSVPSDVATEVGERISRLDAILDLDELRDELIAIESLLADEIVVVPLYAVPNAAAVWVSSFEGFHHVASAPHTWNAAEWHRAGG